MLEKILKSKIGILNRVFKMTENRAITDISRVLALVMERTNTFIDQT